MSRYKRINRIIELVEENDRVLDIGTDHAYVPIFLIKNNITTVADGSEINDNALKIGVENVKKYNLQSYINIFKSDGLKNIDISNYDTFIISGMGAKNISNIINQKNINQKLIIHPTNQPWKIRKQLRKQNYKIVYEEIVFERKTNNIIIKAIKGESKIKKNEIFIGPFLKRDKSNFTYNYYISMQKMYSDLYLKSKNKEHKKIANNFNRGIKWKEKNL